MITMEKGPSVRQHKTSQKKIISNIIIPHQSENIPTWLFGFTGTVKELRQFLKFQRIYLDAGVLQP